MSDLKPASHIIFFVKLAEFHEKGFYATELCVDQDYFEQPCRNDISNDISDSGNSDRDDSKSDGLGEDSSDKIENLRNIRLSRYYYDLEDMNEHRRLGVVSHRLSSSIPKTWQPRLASSCKISSAVAPAKIRAVTLGSNFTARISCQVSFCRCKISGFELVFSVIDLDFRAVD